MASPLAEALIAGDRRALATLLSAVERRDPQVEDALGRLQSLGGRAAVVGFTGPPGAGKSSLVAALTSVIRTLNRTVAVIAVDPTSPISGGAILGDRLRMQQFIGDDGVFIRSMASRGRRGGIASATASAVAALDAAGFDMVLIETVGAGQSDVDVASTADVTVVLQAPGMGDDVQAIKAGILEVADLIVVNKGDRPDAVMTASTLRNSHAGTRVNHPDVLITSAITGAGVPELLQAIDRRLGDAGERNAERRRRRARALVRALVDERVSQRLASEALTQVMASVTSAVVSSAMDPYDAADQVVAALAGP